MVIKQYVPVKGYSIIDLVDTETRVIGASVFHSIQCTLSTMPSISLLEAGEFVVIG